MFKSQTTLPYRNKPGRNLRQSSGARNPEKTTDAILLTSTNITIYFIGISRFLGQFRQTRLSFIALTRKIQNEPNRRSRGGGRLQFSREHNQGPKPDPGNVDLNPESLGHMHELATARTTLRRMC